MKSATKIDKKSTGIAVRTAIKAGYRVRYGSCGIASSGGKTQ